MLPDNKREVGHDQANPISQMIWANTLLLFLFAIPSLSLVVLIRRKPGFRVVQPWMLAISFIVMSMIAGLSGLAGTSPQQVNPNAPPASQFNPLQLITFAVLIMGVIWRVTAWQKIKRGERWHTKSRGVSYLSAVLPVPEHIVQRYVEPAICMGAGIAVMAFSGPPALMMTSPWGPVGLWLFFSGACLSLWEGLLYEVQLNNMLDQYDALIDSEVVNENQAYFSGEKTANPPTIEQTAGISVGFAPELEKAIAARRARAAAAGLNQPRPEPIPVPVIAPTPPAASRSAPAPAPPASEPVSFPAPREEEQEQYQPFIPPVPAEPPRSIPSVPAAPAQPAPAGPRWKCACDVVNEGDHQVCRACGRPKPEPDS